MPTTVRRDGPASGPRPGTRRAATRVGWPGPTLPPPAGDVWTAAWCRRPAAEQVRRVLVEDDLARSPATSGRRSWSPGRSMRRAARVRRRLARDEATLALHRAGHAPTGHGPALAVTPLAGAVAASCASSTAPRSRSRGARRSPPRTRGRTARATRRGCSARASPPPWRGTGRGSGRPICSRRRRRSAPRLGGDGAHHATSPGGASPAIAPSTRWTMRCARCSRELTRHGSPAGSSGRAG